MNDFKHVHFFKKKKKPDLYVFSNTSRYCTAKNFALLEPSRCVVRAIMFAIAPIAMKISTILYQKS